MTNDFLRHARKTYTVANAATLDWMLSRPSLAGGFLNTKQNSLTLKEYDASDGPRGPDFLYGWIQGRGLEALVSHAAFFQPRQPNLAARLDVAGGTLYAALKRLRQPNGHAYFCYDRGMRPVVTDAAGSAQPQDQPADIYTYSDAFVAKGLVAAAHRYAPAELAEQLAYFDRVIAAIDHQRFQMDESQHLGDAALAAQPDDFGPQMILLGAAGMLSRRGLAAHATYADRFITHVLDHHLDVATNLLRNVPGEDACNVGHGIEFVGFALDYLPEDADPGLVATLERVLIASFTAGFVQPGIALSVSISDGRPVSPYCPWWSLPETVRAASLAYRRTGNRRSLEIWHRSHDAFFSTYWRSEPPIAYQTMTRDGPVDFVPATPDLDPGYHTGLSLMAAIGAADALLAAADTTQASR
ncbi:MAG: hypothetical protein P4L98_01540 [Ancalomicrobiaceae bacterium]|nr:hypothetical protein [Ancalomicrobiaceae bacterium]